MLSFNIRPHKITKRMCKIRCVWNKAFLLNPKYLFTSQFIMTYIRELYSYGYFVSQLNVFENFLGLFYYFFVPQTRCQGERVEYVPSQKVEEETKPQRGRSSRSTRSARSVKSARSPSKVSLLIGGN